MDRWLARKITVLGLTSILLLPTNILPHTVSSGLPQLIATIVTMSERINDEENNFEGVNEEDEEGGDDEDASKLVDDEDDDDEDGFPEDEDVTSDSDVAYMEALNKLSGTGGSEITTLLAGE